MGKNRRILFYVSILATTVLSAACGRLKLDMSLVNGQVATLMDFSNEMSLELISLSPGDDPQPQLQLRNTTLNTTIRVYKDDSCANEVFLQNAGSSNTLITLPSLPDGQYLFSVRVFGREKSQQSDCIKANKIYVLDTAAPTINSITQQTNLLGSSSTITVSGTHFVSQTTVDIVASGSRFPCGSLVFIDSNNLSCTVPPLSLGKYDIEVNKPKSGSSTLPNAVEFITPTPTGPLCFNGGIRTTELGVNNVYLGGTFSSVGTCMGGGVPIHKSFGTLSPSLGTFPEVAGTIKTVISDGQNGFFIGGDFSHVGGIRSKNLAHIRGDWTVDPIIGQQTDINGAVSALAYDSASSTLYFGGSFTNITTPLSSQGAIFDGTTGTLNLNQLQILGGTVYASEPDGSGGYYIGGDFAWVGGIPVGRIAHINSGGLLNLTFSVSVDATISTMVLDGSTLYIGGSFSNVTLNTVPYLRNRIAAINIASPNVPLGWNPNANGQVQAIAVTSSAVYVGGSFSNIGGVPRNFLASLNKTTGSVSTWNPQPNNPVTQIIAPNDGSNTIYVGGLFGAIGATPRIGVAAFDALTGNLSPWDPALNGSVRALLKKGNTLYVGGLFSQVGTVARKNLAAIDTTTGLATAWAPEPSGSVYALAADTSDIYVGGSFTVIGNKTRSQLAKVDAISGIARDWNPAPDQTVYILNRAGTMLFVGGNFTSIGGAPRRYLGAINTTTGTPTALSKDCNSFVNTLLLNNNSLFLGGAFTTVDNQSRNRLAAIDLTSYDLLPFNPNISGSVATMALDQGILFFGGTFTSVSSIPRNNIAAVNSNDGSLQPWNPGADNAVNSLVVAGENVYVGGRFLNIGSLSRTRLAAISRTSGLASPWNPNPNGDINTIRLIDGSLIVGGSFTTVGNETRNNLAAIDLTTGNANAWNPSPSATVYSLHENVESIYAGGAFQFLGGMPRSNLAAIDNATGNLASWAPVSNGIIYAIIESGQQVFIGGEFTSINGVSKSNLASVDVNTGTLTPGWSATTDSSVMSLAIYQNILYVGGTFSGVSNENHAGLAAVSASTGGVIGWDGNVDGTVNILKIDGTKLYIGGNFTTIGSMSLPRQSLAVLDLTTQSFDAFAPAINGTVFDIAFSSDSVFLSGIINDIGGTPINGLAVLNKNNASSVDKTWAQLGPNASINGIVIENTFIFVGGNFTLINGQWRSRLAAFDLTTKSLSSWNPEANSTIFKLNYSPTWGLIGGGIISSYNGKARGGLLYDGRVTH